MEKTIIATSWDGENQLGCIKSSFTVFILGKNIKYNKNENCIFNSNESNPMLSTQHQLPNPLPTSEPLTGSLKPTKTIALKVLSIGFLSRRWNYLVFQADMSASY